MELIVTNGTFTLGGTNAYSGGTIIGSGGTLTLSTTAIGSDASLGTAGVGLTFQGGTLSLSDTRSVLPGPSR